MEPRPVATHRRDPPARSRHDRPARSRARHGVVRRTAARRRGHRRRDADRALREARQPPARLAFARAGVGDDAGAAGVVSRDGAARRDARHHVSQPNSTRTWRRGRTRADPLAAHLPIGYVRSLEGRRLAGDARPRRACVARRPAGDRPGALRPRHVRAGHGCHRRHRRDRAVAAEGDGAARVHPGCHAPVRRQLLGSARRVRRACVGQPQQLPRAGAAQPAVQRRPDPRAGRHAAP